MVKVLIGLVAAAILATAGFFGFEFYLQHRVAGEVEAAFEQIRATGGHASHGRVSFDLLSRTVRVSDIATESATQPRVRVKIASFTASGVGQSDPTRFSADTIETTDIEVGAAIAGPQDWHLTAPRIVIKDYSGPAALPRPPVAPSAADLYRFALEQFAAVTASSVTAPSLAATVIVPGAAGGPAVDYTYSNFALRNIEGGRIAAMTAERAGFAANIQQGGKAEEFAGEFKNLAAYDVDSGAALAILDPARANDDKYVRIYRQATFGAYSAAFPEGAKMKADGMTVDDVGLRPSKLQFSELMSIIAAAPTPGVTPSPAQTRDIRQKMAGIYEGIRLGKAEMRGFAMETSQGPFKLAAIRFNLENGKIGEFALEGLDARSPQGPVKLERFALRSLDVANLLRMSSEFSNPGQKSSPDQLFGLLQLVDGAEIKGLVAPYKDSTEPVSVDTLSLNWGQFVGPIPSKVHLTLKMSGPLDASGPALIKMLIAAGMHSAAINVDLGAAWAEGARSFVLDPVVLELGNLLAASARASLANVRREVFSTNPQQAAVMAGQIGAGTIEITVRDTGGIGLAVAQYARTQNVSPDAARSAIIDSIKAGAATMAKTNPDAQVIAGALTRFIGTPQGTLTIKLTPKGVVPALPLIGIFKADPLTALAEFQVQASTAR
jgi:hypothetical protein